jgi:hypothetical protein
MRRLITTVGLVLCSLVAIPTPAFATDAARPACPLEGDYVVALSHDFLLGWNETQNRLGPFPAALPAGTYELTVASWDDHSEKPDQDNEQPNEIWYLSASGAGTEIARSATTPDLPGGQDLAVVSLGRIELTAAVDSLTAHHGFFDAYNPNSVVPLCAALTEIRVAPVAVAVAAAPAAVEPVITASSQGLLAESTPVAPAAPAAAPWAVEVSRTEAPAALPAAGVMGIQAQLTELPNTGLHAGVAAVGLLAISCGLVLLRLGRDDAVEL